MSLDVMLKIRVGPTEPVPAAERIFVREHGVNHEISREEWDRRCPGRTPIVVTLEAEGEVYTNNITHNLVVMARAAGLYDCLWRPDENGIATASQLIPLLSEGLARLRADPDNYSRFNPPNRWGSYEILVNFVADYLKACRKWPQAEVRVSR